MPSVGALVAEGRTSDVYEFGTGSVVKVPRPSVPRHWASKEATFTAAVRELGAPAPEVRDVVQVNGRDAVVFERVIGRSMRELIVENPDDVEAWARELASLHLRILRAGVPGHLSGLVDRMRSKIEVAAQLTPSERVQAETLLERLPRGAALLHGDLHPGNVLLSASGPYAIDWFDASVGHPVADVVRSSVLIRPLDSPGERPHLPGVDAGLGRAFHDAYVAEMGDVLSGQTHDLRQWEAVVAASRLAEDAEADDKALLGLWRDGQVPGESSALASVLSADQGSQ